MVEWLPELPVSYDCSVPHSDPYEPQPGGCCSLWPFFLGSLVELPYTLPQDHTLFTLLRAGSVDLWLSQVDAIEQRFGLVQCLSHPDPGYFSDGHFRLVSTVANEMSIAIHNAALYEYITDQAMRLAVSIASCRATPTSSARDNTPTAFTGVPLPMSSSWKASRNRTSVRCT